MLVELPAHVETTPIVGNPALSALQVMDTSYYAQAQPDPETALSMLGGLASKGNTQALAFFAEPPVWVFQDEPTTVAFLLNCFNVAIDRPMAKFLSSLDLSHLPANLAPQEISENYLLDVDCQTKLLIVIRLAQLENAQAKALLLALDFSRPADMLSQRLTQQLSDETQELGPIPVTIELYSGMLLLERAAELGNPSAKEILSKISAMFDVTQTPTESFE